MEHFFHIFGGGCGEHMVWPWLASIGIGLTFARHYIVGLWHRLRGRRALENAPVECSNHTHDK